MQFVTDEGVIKQYHNSGHVEHTTNNRMELLAAIKALSDIPTSLEIPVKLHSDSQYVVLGMTTWRRNWIKKQWRDVKNPDLWQQLSALSDARHVSYEWIRGHAGHPENELVDTLALAAAKKYKKHTKQHYDRPQP